MAEYQQRLRTAKTLYPNCDIGRAEKLRRVNPASPGLRLCQNCAAALSIVQKIKGKTRSRRAEALPNTLECISDAIDEQPHWYGQDCLNRGKHPVLCQ